MANATTIRPHEAAHFGKHAEDWWNPKGSSAMLHRLNPVRLRFIRDTTDAQWPQSRQAARPLAGKRALDVGCGAGLLCEPLARLGACVTGVDAAPENITAAQDHAKAGGLDIDYRCGDIAAMKLGDYDLVSAMEVIEHVNDKPAFVTALAAAMKDDGLLILSTPNRTVKSRLLMVEGAERLGLIPRGTHHWDDFINPDELVALLGKAGLVMGKPKGIAMSITRGLTLSDDLSLNYIVTARKA